MHYLHAACVSVKRLTSSGQVVPDTEAFLLLFKGTLLMPTDSL